VKAHAAQHQVQRTFALPLRCCVQQAAVFDDQDHDGSPVDGVDASGTIS
jgi:hypothetical protein